MQIIPSVDKTVTGFKRRFDILWDDGARTELENHHGILHGRDGNVYLIRRTDEHEKVCEEILSKNGYSFRK